MYENHKPLTVNVISDIHYYAKSIGITGPAFKKANLGTPSDLFNNEEIMDALANQLIKDPTEIVLLSGDTTYNGEPQSHEGCLKFLQKLKDNGKKVFVITATHDYRDGNVTNGYNEEGTYTINTYPREKLWDIYYNFGPNEAIATHRQSMSYVVQLENNYRLFALNDDKNLKGASGFSDDLFEFIKEQVEDAKKNDQFILVMTHHPMISPSPFYKIIGGGNMMGEHELRREQFADMGIPFALTGHTHIQDISYIHSEKGNIFYDITTAAPIAYPGTYRKLTMTPAERKIYVEAVEITEKFGFELKGKTLKEHLSNKFFGMIREVLISAGTDIRELAGMVGAFSVSPLLIFRIGWLIKPFAKLLSKLKIKHAAFLCKKETGLKKSDYADIKDESIIDFIMSLIANLYGGDSPYTPDTAQYKITMGICSILDSILRTVGVKISKLVKGMDSVREIVEPLLYNSGICDEKAELIIFPEHEGEKIEIEEKQYDVNIKKSRKGPFILILLVLLIIVLLPVEILFLLFGFIKNQIQFRKELKKKD